MKRHLREHERNELDVRTFITCLVVLAIGVAMFAAWGLLTAPH